MKPLRWLLNGIFLVSVALIVSFFIILSGGGRLLEIIFGEGVKQPVMRFLAAAMPLAILGTLAETITRPQHNSARRRKTLVTLVMAGLFALGTWFLKAFG